MEEESERQLLLQAQTGDPDAFSILVERYSSRIYGTCFSLLGNRQDAEDCVQDTFLKAFRSICNYNFQAAFYTWLYRIAINACHDYRRKNSRSIIYSLDDSLETEEGSVYQQIADDKPLPDEQFVTAESNLLIRQQIDCLPDYLKEILILRDLEGLSYHELSAAFHLSEGTVKSRLSRARRQLMEKIKQREQSMTDKRLKGNDH